MPDLLKAIILGIVEGVTEFLPVSSTGHLLLCERWMGINLEAPDSFWKTFAVFIQIGAILAVVVYFRRRILDLLLGKPGGVAHAAGDLARRPERRRSRRQGGRRAGHGPDGRVPDRRWTRTSSRPPSGSTRS